MTSVLAVVRPVPLPESFGNEWMARLDEVPAPEPVAAWPPAPGWIALAALALIALGWLAWRALRRWRRRAPRRIALALLTGLEARLESEGPVALCGLSEILKRVALSSYPRTEVAALAGAPLLHFLDRGVGTTEFSRGAGRALPRLAYDPAATSTVPIEDARELLRLSRRWVLDHPAPGSG